jgi:hypothetical protein
MLRRIALGGAIDRTGKKPSIGGSSDALIDTKTNTAFLWDYGAYHTPPGERERISQTILSLPKPEAEFHIIGEERFPVIRSLTSPALDPEDESMFFGYIPDHDALRDCEKIFCVASHGHADHIGLLPYLKRQYGERLEVFMTAPTLALAGWNWRDSLKIADRCRQETLYSIFDVQNLEQAIKIIGVGDSFSLGPFEIEVFHAGHIRGAISALVNRRIFYSGDICFHDQHTVPGAMIPKDRTVDCLVAESTYAGRLVRQDRREQDRREEEERYIADCEAVLSSGGKVLNPSLSIGRSGELFSILKKYGIADRFDVHLDGAACSTARIYQQFQALDPSVSNHFIETKDQRLKVMYSDGPCVVIVPAGNFGGGHAVEYAVAWANDPRNFFGLSSFQDRCSPGFSLLHAPQGSIVEIGERKVRLNARVQMYGFSAHMIGADLLELADTLKAKRTFLVHGEEEQMEHIIQASSRPMEKSFIGEQYEL